MLLPTLAAMVVLLGAVCASLGAAWRALTNDQPAQPAERSVGIGTDAHPMGVLSPSYWVAPSWLADEEPLNAHRT
jgi:hypothetical protein